MIVFTASHQCYADVVLDYLDPTNKLIHHRLYRDSCVVTQGIFIKDLRIFLNRNLSDVVIVDNSVYSFAYQVNNGIPIISWFDDRNDTELYNLIDYLNILKDATDIRDINRETFKLLSVVNVTEQKLKNPTKAKVIHRKSRSTDQKSCN